MTVSARLAAWSERGRAATSADAPISAEPVRCPFDIPRHAGHLLLADEATGAWPAAPFLEHLTESAPGRCRPWLDGHAERLAAGGPGMLDALWRLALVGALTPAGARVLLPHGTARPSAWSTARAGEVVAPAGGPLGAHAPDGRTGRRLAAGIEELLKDAVDAVHAGHVALQAVAEHQPHGAQAQAGDRVVQWARVTSTGVFGQSFRMPVSAVCSAGSMVRFQRVLMVIQWVA
ncbi:hypothetical protein ABZ307_38340 [Streptomyces griseorubiginosus]|uniref:hypothetical protein n=1 Tax=Streptomyces griseorubiginosus TaxID=67304 RepID=UPI0033B1B2E3